MDVPKLPAGQFQLLYFASAASFTGRANDHLPAPLAIEDLFEKLERMYPGITSKVLDSCAVTVNMDYVDVDAAQEVSDSSRTIKAGDEVAIIPPALFLALDGVSDLRVGIPNRRPPRQRPAAATHHHSAMSRPDPANMVDPRLLPPGANHDNAPSSFSTSPYPRVVQSREMSPRAAGVKQEGPYFGGQSQQQRNDEERRGYGVEDITHQDDSYVSDGAQQSPANDEAKRSRACEACRGLKVRCDQDPVFPDRPCRRCTKANRQCIVTQPSRKRQKKADSRVADLERKLDALTAALHAQQNGATIPHEQPKQDVQHVHHTPATSRPISYHADAEAEPRRATYPDLGSEQQQPPSKKRKTFSTEASASDSVHAAPRDNPAVPEQPGLAACITDAMMKRFDSATEFRPLSYHIAPELIIQQINELVDPTLHKRIFDRFVNEMAPTFPVVVFPSDMTAPRLLREKPVLLLSILATAEASVLSPEKATDVSDAVTSVLADCVLKKACKSLELIQAILVKAMWHRPPERPDQSNFYQFIHMAACMGIEIGLGRKFTPVKGKRGFGGIDKGKFLQIDSDTVEARRTWLGCYYLCASVAMVLRRPNLIRWNNYMQGCIDVLDTSKDALPTDRVFTQFVRIQKICEDISVSFLMDDASATISIADPKVSYTLDIYEQKIKDWEDRLPKELASPQLIFFRDVTELYLHEIALHVNHNIDDFKLPFTEASLRAGLQYSERLTQKQMAALESCISAAHRVIRNYCTFGLAVLSAVPTLLFFVRTVYALVVLIKMHMAVVQPGSEIGKVIKAEDLKVVENLELLWELFNNMTKQVGLVKPGPKVLQILAILREWFYRFEKGEPVGDGPSAGDGHHHHSRSHHDAGGRSKLHLLSEAATAGSAPSSTDPKPMRSYTDPARQTWSYDSPTALPYKHSQGSWDALRSPHSQNSPSSGTSGAGAYSGSNMMNLGMGPPSSTHYPPQSDQIDSRNGGSTDGSYSSIFTPGANDNYDWNATLDLEQVLDGAFRDFDMSGDLGTWFMGDTANAYQIPPDPVPSVAGFDAGASRKW